jgi:hypothetical protein
LRNGRSARYSLIVSIEAPEAPVDLYAILAAQIGITIRPNRQAVLLTKAIPDRSAGSTDCDRTAAARRRHALTQALKLIPRLTVDLPK